MLYTFYGTDIEKIRARSNALVEALQVKRPDAAFFRLHHENFEEGKLTELLGSIGLFSSKYIVSIDNILTGISDRKIESGKVPAEIILELLPTLKTSPHIWIIVEDAMFGLSSGKELGIKQAKEIGEIKKSLEKHSDKIESHDLSSVQISRAGNGPQNKFGSGGRSSEVNSFTFTDAFFNKDTFQSIQALNNLFAQEIVAEEIHGALWWQTKVLMQVQKNNTKALTSFMLQKASRFIKNWSDVELVDLTNQIILSYHNSHLGKCDLKDELMKLALRMRR